MSTTKNKVGLKETIAILSLYFVSMGFTVVTPAMAKLAAAFPDNNFSLISTLPTLFVVFATLWAGTVAGKKVKYRTLALTGCIIFTVSGTLPAIVGGSFAFILVTRALVGIGLGLMAPLGNALIIGLYEGQKQAAYLGYGTLLMNGGGIILQMLGGALADIGWKTTFFGHLLGVISIVCLIFLPEPEKAPVQQETGGKPAAKDKISPFVYAIAILFLLFNVLNYPVMLNMSLMFEMKGAGGATMAATALSLYTVAGCVAGFLFGTIFKIMKRFLSSHCLLPLGNRRLLHLHRQNHGGHVSRYYFDRIRILRDHACSLHTGWYAYPTFHSGDRNFHCHGTYEPGRLPQQLLAVSAESDLR